VEGSCLDVNVLDVPIEDCCNDVYGRAKRLETSRRGSRLVVVDKLTLRYAKPFGGMSQDEYRGGTVCMASG